MTFSLLVDLNCITIFIEEIRSELFPCKNVGYVCIPITYMYIHVVSIQWRQIKGLERVNTEMVCSIMCA